MRTATVREYNQVTVTPHASKRFIPGSRVQSIEWTFKGIPIASKTEMLTRGKVTSTEYQINEAYLVLEPVPTYSPWGNIQSRTELAQGIQSVATASHGGIWLSKVRVEELKAVLGDDCDNWLKDWQWWEEDCDWVVPIVFFADSLDATDRADQVQHAARQLFAMKREPYSRWFEAMKDKVMPLTGYTPAGWDSVEA